MNKKSDREINWLVNEKLRWIEKKMLQNKDLLTIH